MLDIIPRTDGWVRGYYLVINSTVTLGICATPRRIMCDDRKLLDVVQLSYQYVYQHYFNLGFCSFSTGDPGLSMPSSWISHRYQGGVPSQIHTHQTSSHTLPTSAVGSWRHRSMGIQKGFSESKRNMTLRRMADDLTVVRGITIYIGTIHHR